MWDRSVRFAYGKIRKNRAREAYKHLNFTYALCVFLHKEIRSEMSVSSSENVELYSI